MRKKGLWTAAVIGGLAIAVGSVGLTGASPALAQGKATASARKVANFVLPDQKGVHHELYRAANLKAVVLITQGNGCPIVRNSAVSYRELAKQYLPKGVEFLMLNANLHDKPEAVAAELKEFDIPIPVLMDSKQAVAKALGVERTAEVIVINPKTWTIAYRGPVDDRVVYERQKNKAEKTWAKDALDALIAGKRPAVAYQQTNGCLINIENG